MLSEEFYECTYYEFKVKFPYKYVMTESIKNKYIKELMKKRDKLNYHEVAVDSLLGFSTETFLKDFEESCTFDIYGSEIIKYDKGIMYITSKSVINKNKNIQPIRDYYTDIIRDMVKVSVNFLRGNYLRSYNEVNITNEIYDILTINEIKDSSIFKALISNENIDIWYNINDKIENMSWEEFKYIVEDFIESNKIKDLNPSKLYFKYDEEANYYVPDHEGWWLYYESTDIPDVLLEKHKNEFIEYIKTLIEEPLYCCGLRDCIKFYIKDVINYFELPGGIIDE
jgi:hypothetical protein